MSLIVEGSPVRAAVCPSDGMPLYPTIVGPRCPLCGLGSSAPARDVRDRPER